MNNIELYLLKLFFSYSFFQKHQDSLDLSFVKQNHPDLYRIFITLKLFHEKFPEKNVSSVEELEVFHHSQFPPSNKRGNEELSLLYKRLDSIVPDEQVADEYFREHGKRTKAAKIAFLGLEVAEGKRTFEELISGAESLREELAQGDYKEFVSDDAAGIVDRMNEPGLSWPLTTLNQMLGPLRKGDFGFIFARPESGKTTFLAQAATYFAEQQAQLSTPTGPILWFNNEQVGAVVLTRCQQACLGLTSQELFKNYEEKRQEYRNRTGGKIYIYDAASIHRRDVDRMCRRYSPSLIIFDQIDKIKGFDSDRYDLELKVLYQWARELAKEYGPVIGVCQAGASGEGKKYLSMDDVDSSKTAKQGEADWILGIGKSNQDGMESVRHLHLCKNKLFGGPESIPELRHGKRDVLLFPQVARYKDIE